MQGFNFTIHPNQPENHCRISIPAPNAPQIQKQTSSPTPQMPRQFNENMQMTPNPNVKNYFIDFNRRIGKGNFSTVYMAYDKKHPNVNLAVKVVNVQKLKQQNLEVLIKSQVQVLLFMNHQNVLSCKDVFWDETYCYIFTQFCQGGSLQSKIKRVQVKNLRTNQPFQNNKQQLQSRIQNIYLLEQMGLQIPRIFQRQMLPIISDIFYAMLYLEKAHIIHRDIKAANIFLKNNKAVVADFGFAKFYSQPFYDLNIGSLPFMPPEAITNSLYGSKTDVWAFGVLLYEIFHGESPYAKSHDMKQLIQKAYTPLNLSMIRSDLSVELKELILNCLQVDMQKRKNFSELQKMWYCNKLFQNGNITNKNKIQSDYYLNDGRIMNLSITQAKKAQSVPIISGDKIVVQNISDYPYKLDSDRSFGSKLKDKINQNQNNNKIFLSPTESPNKASKSVGKTIQISSFNDKKIVQSPAPIHNDYLLNNTYIMKPNQNPNDKGQINFKISINGSPVNIGQVKQNNFINYKNQTENSIQTPHQNYSNLASGNNFLTNSGHSTNLLKKGSQSSANSTTYNANPIMHINETNITPNQFFMAEDSREQKPINLVKRQSQNITMKSNANSSSDLTKVFKINSGIALENKRVIEDGVKETIEKQKQSEKKVQNDLKQKEIKSELLNSSNQTKQKKKQANGEEEKTSLKETLLSIQQIRNFYKLAIILKDRNKRLSEIKNRLIIKSVKDINKVYETVENNKVDLSSYDKNRDMRPMMGEKKQEVSAQQANIASRKNKLIGIIKDYQNQFENQLKRRQLNNNLNLKSNGQNNGSRIPEFLTTRRDTKTQITSPSAARSLGHYFHSYGFSLKSNNTSINNYKSSHSLPEDIQYIVQNQLGQNSNINGDENFSARGAESFENYLAKLQEILEDIMHVQRGFLDMVKNKSFQILKNSRKNQQKDGPENTKVINQIGVNRCSFGNGVLNINSNLSTNPIRNFNQKLDIMEQMSRLKWKQKNA